MTPQQFLEYRQEAAIYLIFHYWWVWLFLIAAAVGLKWLFDNYYDV
jgi:hypothetical protein